MWISHRIEAGPAPPRAASVIDGLRFVTDDLRSTPETAVPKAKGVTDGLENRNR